jgi:hypothetical protein
VPSLNKSEALEKWRAAGENSASTGWRNRIGAFEAQKRIRL